MKGFETFCILFVWISIHSIGIFFFAGGECVDLVVISNKGREENLMGIFTKLQKLCLHKIFNISSTTKINFVNFEFYNSRITKKLFFSQLFTQIQLCFSMFLFFKKVIHHKECLRHVFVYAMMLTWTEYI